MTTITGTPATDACLVSRCGNCFSDDCQHFCHPGKERSCKCGAHIVFMGQPGVGGSWMATDGERPGDFWCADGSLHKPACPPSEVKDMIVRWDELEPGDLFVCQESWAIALTVNTYEDDWQGHKWMRTDITYRDEGERNHGTDRHADRLVAVRRYVTED